jgi:hypothetical protein
MAYIGRGIDNISQIEVLDIITFTNSAGPYNILKSSVAFLPSTPQSLLIEVDGIIQAPASYTITGSTITFGVSMPSSSTMNSILHFGTGIITTPADLSVTTAKIATDAVTTAKILDNNVTVAKLPTTLDISGNTVTLPASVSGLGTGITNAQLAGSIADAKITGLSSSKLSGALPAISGASLTALPATLPASSGVNLTALNATNLGSGTVPTARLGTGTADGTTFLRGDQTYAAAGGGKINQYQYTVLTDYSQSSTTTGTWIDVTNLNVSITPSATDSVIIIQYSLVSCNSGGEYPFSRVQRDIAGAGYGDWNYNVGEADGSIYRVSGPMGYTTSNDQITGTMSSLLKDSTHNTTSAITYKLQFVTGGGTFKVNRCVNATTGTGASRSLSWISAMEVLA